MQEVVVRTRLLSYADWVAASNGFLFGDGARQDITQGLEQAAAQIAAMAPAGASPTQDQLSRIAEAERATERLVEAMIHGSKRLPGYTDGNPDRIGETTFRFAMSELCPLWPFC